MNDIKLIVFFLLLGSFGHAQVDTTLLRTAEAKTLKRMGRSAMNQDDPSSAIALLEAYIKHDSSDAKSTALLAKAYMQIRDYERAKVMFLRAYNISSSQVPEALYYHAMMQKSHGEYDSAKVSFERFNKEYKGPQKILKRQARKEIVFCDSIGPLLNAGANVNVTRLDTSINKLNAEGSPLSLDSTTILFTSLRTDATQYVVEEDYSAIPKKQLYVAKKTGGEWKYAGRYEQLNTDDFNTANPALSVDNMRMYFTRCKRNLSGKMLCAIYVSEKFDGKWSVPVKLPKEINHPRYTSTMPAVTNDPVKGNDVIYYVTDNPRGKGGMDIWYTVYDKKKRIYKKPRNVGNKINTPQNEITPFFDNETRTLYFSSEGLGGLGGFDIYRSLGDGRRLTGAQNLGAPFNSGADDIYYTISGQRDEGFFVSNRKGGAALPNSTCCDDLYSYKLPDFIHIDLKGTVFDMVETDLPVSNANVDIYVKDKTSGERFFVKSTTSDSLGNYKTRLQPDQDYFVVIKKKDFLGITDEVTTRGLTDKAEINRTAKIMKKPTGVIAIPDFNYDFGRADLNEAQKKILDNMLVEMLIANPEIIVEIQSHTDSKGNELFNLKLSQKRAENIINYAISKGIEPERLKAKGFGETSPLAPNENADGSDNPENRAMNRRTEFKIIGVVETEEPRGIE